MADACDVSDIALEAAMERAALEVAKKAAIIPPPEHECRECGDPTDGARWCSKSCCDTWSQRLGNK